MPRHLFRPALLSFIALSVCGLLASVTNVGAQEVRGRRRASPHAAAPRSLAIPSPRSVLGFTPGDDRTVADWRQISDYFTRLDRASGRVPDQ